MNKKKVGQIVLVNRTADKGNWSECVVDNEKNRYYTRDDQTRMRRSTEEMPLEMTDLLTLGSVVEFEVEGTTITQIYSIRPPIDSCTVCSKFVRTFEDQRIFNSIKDEIHDLVKGDQLRIRIAKEKTLITRDFYPAQSIKWPEIGYELSKFSLLCRKCNSIIVFLNMERSKYFAQTTYLRYPYTPILEDIPN